MLNLLLVVPLMFELVMCVMCVLMFAPQALHGELRLMNGEYELLARMNDMASGSYSDLADLAAGLAVFMQARLDAPHSPPLHVCPSSIV